jgi:hypothetical protein
MIETTSAAAVENAPILFAAQIAAQLNYTGRGLRKLIARGVFPKPDGNLCGRDFWRAENYRHFQVDLFAGKFRLERRPRNLSSQPRAPSAA